MKKIIVIEGTPGVVVRQELLGEAKEKSMSKEQMKLLLDEFEALSSRLHAIEITLGIGAEPKQFPVLKIVSST